MIWDHEFDKNPSQSLINIRVRNFNYIWVYLVHVSTLWANFGGKCLIGKNESFFDTLWYSFTVDASLYNQLSALHDEVSSAQPFFIFHGI